MTILNWFLAALFAVHGIIFLRLTVKKRSFRLALLVGTFALLTVAFAMLALDFRPAVAFPGFSLQLPTVLRILAAGTTICAISLLIHARLTSKDPR